MKNEYGITLDKNGYAPSVVDYYGDIFERCFLCDWRGDLARHEIFNGYNRQKSKALGLWVNLCPRCHMDLHEHPADYRWLKQQAQMKAMKAHDWTVEEFRNEFGKNYL